MPPNRRVQILAHAENHFAEHGYQGASLSAIARASGLGNPGLLHHFPSKAKLYRAVLESLAEELTGRLDRALEGQSAPADRLRAFVIDHVEWMIDHPRAIRVIQRELLDNAERVMAARVLPLKPYLLTAMALIEAARDAGAVRDDIAPTAVLCLILGTLSYAAVARPTLYQSLDRVELAHGDSWSRDIAAMVLRAIENDKQ